MDGAFGYHTIVCHMCLTPMKCEIPPVIFMNSLLWRVSFLEIFEYSVWLEFYARHVVAWAELPSKILSGSGAFSERSSGECRGARDGKLAVLSLTVVNMSMMNSVNPFRRVGILLQNMAKNKKQRREKRKKTCTENSSVTAKQRAGN